MFFRKTRLSLPVCLAVSLCVFPGLAQAEPRTQKLSLFASLRAEMQSTTQILWDSLIGIWAKSGVSIDPNGAPGTPTTSPGGASIDPSGGPSDEGGSIDPNGKP